jgi:ATP-dependent RNA helicase DeaD
MPFPATHPALERALLAREYTEPTAVQSAVLQAEPERDLLVSAQTGSGKTVAYGLAFASTLLGDADRFDRAGPPLALVVAPTRELAMQVHRELSWLYEQTGARVVSCVGGMDARFEQRALAAGCHIVVGTPGRLKDHIERRQLNLSAMRVVVLDEADEMLDLGFREDLEFILSAAPDERRTLLFSATIAHDIAALARRFQKNALRIDTLVRHQAHADIEYRAVRMQAHETEAALINVLRFYEARSVLVFCATREAVRRLHASLEQRGFAAVALSGELSQTDRTHALQSLRDGRARVCVATDVAARGLDLPDLGLVIHADLPTDREILLHRSGRTGRAGRKGVCVLLVPHPKRRRAEALLMSANLQCSWSGPPSADEIRALDQERLLADPVLTERASGEDAALARKLLEGRSAEDIAAALIRMHRAKLPAPAELFDSQPQGALTAAHAARPERAPKVRAEMGATSWFRITIGRQNNADPKWLLPLICRVGEVTKSEIGAIRVFDRETKFEIVDAAAARFAAAVDRSTEKEFQISPAGAAPPPKAFVPRGPMTPRAGAPKKYGRKKAG